MENFIFITMNKTEKQAEFFIPSISDLLKLIKIDSIYATSNSGKNSPRKDNYPPCPPSADKAGGDAPAQKCPCRVPEATKSAGDRGITGAGVTGSRTSRVCEKDKEHALPEGASNPGLLRYIHNAARYRLPQCFEGACVSLKQSAKNNWVVGHSMSFSSVSPGGYKVLLSYVDKDKYIGLPYFVMEAAPGGQMSCEVRVGPSQGTRATVVAQIADAEIYSFESIFDAYFKTCTCSLITVNREFIALHYLQVNN